MKNGRQAHTLPSLITSSARLQMSFKCQQQCSASHPRDVQWLVVILNSGNLGGQFTNSSYCQVTSQHRFQATGVHLHCLGPGHGECRHGHVRCSGEKPPPRPSEMSLGPISPLVPRRACLRDSHCELRQTRGSTVSSPHRHKDQGKPQPRGVNEPLRRDSFQPAPRYSQQCTASSNTIPKELLSTQPWRRKVTTWKRSPLCVEGGSVP